MILFPQKSHHNQLQTIILWNQDPLPPPREEVQIDTTAGDAELFLKHLCPLGHASVPALGDLWHDVSRYIYIYTCVKFLSHISKQFGWLAAVVPRHKSLLFSDIWLGASTLSRLVDGLGPQAKHVGSVDYLDVFM